MRSRVLNGTLTGQAPIGAWLRCILSLPKQGVAFSSCQSKVSHGTLQGRRELNPRHGFWRPGSYHWTTPPGSFYYSTNCGFACPQCQAWLWQAGRPRLILLHTRLRKTECDFITSLNSQTRLYFTWYKVLKQIYSNFANTPCFLAQGSLFWIQQDIRHITFLAYLEVGITLIL